MRFSITIPTYNRINRLRRCLAAATSQDYQDYEVIVVDDGSTDGTGDMIKQEFPKANYIRQEPNRGPAAARNAGIRAATGEIIAFTDDDCLPPLDWLTRLADGYMNYPTITGVGGFIEAPQHLLQSNLIAQYERSIGRDRYGARDAEVLGGYNCPAGGTNNMSYRRKALLDIQGFDETFPYPAAEDADLKWRLCQQGAQLLYTPVKVNHLQSYTWNNFRRQQIRRGRGVIYFERKHFGRAPSISRILLRIAKRSLLLFRDLVSRPKRRLAIIHFAAGWYDCLGQLYETRKVSG
jgi:glycosyltransferase involved in cell wall biosynthesis